MKKSIIKQFINKYIFCNITKKINLLLIASFMFGISKWNYILFTGNMLILLELILIMYQINRTENSNVTKILKGGSL